MKPRELVWQSFLFMSFSKRLAAVRKSRNLTQAQVSEITGIHLSQVKKYESGESQPSLDVLRKITLALHISADELLFDQEERGPSDDFRLQFEAISKFSGEDKKVAKELLDILILKHTANSLANK